MSLILRSQNNEKEVSAMADKTIVCKDCGAEFIFNESEQAFYKEKGFENEPQRCPSCRAAKKQQMRNNRNNVKRY
jgi:DNA replicative helicase MCM subunit Mcm2 (Cdc46/Mcm family)